MPLFQPEEEERKKISQHSFFYILYIYYIYITMHRFRIKLQVLNKEIVNRKMTRSRSGLSQM